MQKYFWFFNVFYFFNIYIFPQGKLFHFIGTLIQHKIMSAPTCGRCGALECPAAEDGLRLGSGEDGLGLGSAESPTYTRNALEMSAELNGIEFQSPDLFTVVCSAFLFNSNNKLGRNGAFSDLYFNSISVSATWVIFHDLLSNHPWKVNRWLYTVPLYILS